MCACNEVCERVCEECVGGLLVNCGQVNQCTCLLNLCTRGVFGFVWL